MNELKGESFMKVLNIMTSALHYNGIGMSLLNYYRNIDSKKVQMDFLVPNVVEEKLKQDFTVNGNNFYELSYKGEKMHQKRPLMYCKKLYKIIKKEKYDIVHVHGSSAMMFLQLITAKIAGVKIRIAHSRNTSSDHNFLNILCKPFFAKSYTKAFACGKEAGEWLFGKKKEVTIIPNGKDCNMFEFKQGIRDEYRKKYNLVDKKVIGHIGNFNYQKNHEFLIEVFNELCKIDKNYYLVLAGKGTLEEEIHRKVEELGIEDKVLFLGQIAIEEVSNWLNAMDIMVFPSRYEGFPNVLIEWQIAGLQCVIASTITPDVKVTNLVQFESLETSPSIWAENINKINIEDREESKENIKDQIRKSGYDIKENAKRLEKSYLELKAK